MWSAISSADGTYLLAVPPGRYHIHFQRSSFVARHAILDLAAGENRTLELRLEIERVSENVVVTANAQPSKLTERPRPWISSAARKSNSAKPCLSRPSLHANRHQSCAHRYDRRPDHYLC